MAPFNLPDISTEPIRPPPPGQVSDFVNPPSRKNTIFISAGICLPLISLFALLRFYTKLRILKKSTWDDFTFGLALVGGILYICLIVAETAGGPYGLHLWDTTLEDYTKKRLLLSLLAETLYGPCIWFIKLCLFILYLNLFGVIVWLRYNAYAGAVLTGVFYSTTAILFVVFCGPEDGQSRLSYLRATSSPKCAQAYGVVYAQGAMNIFSDLYLFALPLPVVWSLRMPFKEKLGVVAMFSTGLIACIASVLGLLYRIRALQSTDSTWETIPAQSTAIVEITAGLSVCCMPTIKTALKRVKGPIKYFSIPSDRDFLSAFRQKAAIKQESIERISDL